MLRLDVRADIRPLVRQMTQVQKRQAPFAIARGLTQLAQTAVVDLQGEMHRRFDKPTRFTLGAFAARPAKRGELTAYVVSRGPTAKGRAALKYLGPEISGGPRRMKGFELKLTALAGGQFVVPARGAVLDSFGNLRRSLLKDLFASLAQPGGRKFVVAYQGHDRTKRPIGVYQLVSKGVVKPILTFLPRAPNYRARLLVDATVTASVRRNAAQVLAKAFADALRTARR